MWSDLDKFAPHTKKVFEAIGKAKIHPVLERIPNWLLDGKINQTSKTWGSYLNRTSEYGVTNRERLLRYLITRSVVDQGSDIQGVEEWHEGTFSALYAMGLPVLDDLTLLVKAYPTILEVADQMRVKTINDRSAVWAAESETRKEGAYWPFTVDGQRGKGNTHWFLTARVFPTLLLAQVVQGGLSELVFGNSSIESPKEMARRLRNDSDYKRGLSWVMGDKACDLFAKWAIGSYRLSEGMPCNWTPQDCPIPMDQRIGRLMIRCGFMDEFYGVAAEMSTKSHGWTPRDGQSRPASHGQKIPMGKWHLTVMDFRRQGRVAIPHRTLARDWVSETSQEFGRKFAAANTGPQDIISLLCLSYSEEFGVTLTPVEVDDYFMEVGGRECWDVGPKCGECPLSEHCQANNDASMIELKNCFT